MNVIFLMGNLGRDPELTQVKDTQMCVLSVATTDKWKDQAGQMQERVDWHKVKVWGKQAEHCAQYLSKGRQVLVEGTIRYDKYQDDDGRDVRTTEVKAHRVRFLGGNGEKKIAKPPTKNDFDIKVDPSYTADEIPF